MDGGAWWAAVHEVAKSRAWLSYFTFTFHFHALEKEMVTHSSILAWRIPGTAACWAAIYGVTQSWTRLTLLRSSSIIEYLHNGNRPSTPMWRDYTISPVLWIMFSVAGIDTNQVITLLSFRVPFKGTNSRCLSWVMNAIAWNGFINQSAHTSLSSQTQ